MISNAKTFAFSAENPTGTRAGGSRGGDCTKLSPTVTIRAGETVTLVEFHDLVMELGLDFTDRYLGIFVKLYDCGGFVAYFAGCGDIEFHD